MKTQSSHSSFEVFGGASTRCMYPFVQFNSVVVLPILSQIILPL